MGVTPKRFDGEMKRAEVFAGYSEADVVLQMTAEDEAPDTFADFEPTGDIETDMAAEIEHLADKLKDPTGFRARYERENQRLVDTLDSGYYVCLVFGNRDQRETFTRALGWDVLGTVYIDGRKVASTLGVELPPDPDLRTEVPPPARRWMPHVLNPEDVTE